MAEKKHIVIKLKFPTGQMSGKKIPAANVITEWNYTRIVLALAVIVALVGLGGYFFLTHQQTNAAATPAIAPVTVLSAPVPSSDIPKAQGLDKGVQKNTQEAPNR